MMEHKACSNTFVQLCFTFCFISSNSNQQYSERTKISADAKSVARIESIENYKCPHCW